MSIKDSKLGVDEDERMLLQVIFSHFANEKVLIPKEIP